MDHDPRIILASSSPRRKELLKQLGVSFEVVAAQATEIQPEHLTPEETCQINACRKARWVAKQNPDALVIGADTLVFLDSKVLGKPKTMDEAVSMLMDLQGQTHRVITGVCLLHLRRHEQRVFAETTSVRFKKLSQDQIIHYLKVVNPLDKAGGYAIQEHGEQIVASINGSYSNVVGLPMERVGQFIAP